MSGEFVVITPCRNESEHLPFTIRSMVGQTALPATWVIVDDGSTDDTREILREAAAEHPFIEIVRRDDRGRRSVGPGVVEAFYAGLQTVDLDQYEFLCKLDADLELPPRYFETVLDQMEADPCLGNFSGNVYLRQSDATMVPEQTTYENAIGAAKFYRVACFNDIGGFVKGVCWDGIDGHMCRMKGWVPASRDEPELRIVHRRLMGSSGEGIWSGRKRWGRGKQFMGSALYYVLAAGVYRMFERPFAIGGLGIVWGYVGAMVRGARRYEDPAFRKFLRRFEVESLLRGKRRTVERYNRRIREERASQAADRGSFVIDPVHEPDRQASRAAN